jgi:hypothetical protein
VISNNGSEVDCSIQDVKSSGVYGTLGMGGNHLVNEFAHLTDGYIYNRFILSNSGKLFDTWGRQYGTTDYVKINGKQYARRPSRLVNLDSQIGGEKIEQFIASKGKGNGLLFYNVLVFRTDAGKIYTLRLGTGKSGSSQTTKDRFNRPIIGPQSRLSTIGITTDYGNRYLVYPLSGVPGANWTKLMPSVAAIRGTSSNYTSDRMFAYNSTDNLWYSWGGYISCNYTGGCSPHQPGDNLTLLRQPADIDDSVTPRPATILNKILADNNTSLQDPENLDYASSGILFHKQNSAEHTFFLTTDGILNVVKPDGNYRRFKIEGPTPGSVDSIIQVSYANNFNGASGTGPAATSYNHMLLTKSGNVYEISVRNLPAFASQDNTPVDLMSFPANQYISEQVYTLAQLDNIKFKYILDMSYGNDNANLLGISEEGIMYTIDRDPSANPLVSSGVYVHNSITTTYPNFKSPDIPRIDKVLAYRPALHLMMIFKEKGTNQIWKYGFGAEPTTTYSGSIAAFLETLPHGNLNNHTAYRTTGVNLDSAYYLPFYKNNNCAQSFIFD